MVLSQGKDGGLMFLCLEDAPNLPGATPLIADVHRVQDALSAGVMLFASDTMIRTAESDMAIPMLRLGMAV